MCKLWLFHFSYTSLCSYILHDFFRSTRKFIILLLLYTFVNFYDLEIHASDAKICYIKMFAFKRMMHHISTVKLQSALLL
jgi:hypothetical protein